MMKTKEEIEEQLAACKEMLEYWENSDSFFRKEVIEEYKAEIHAFEWVLGVQGK